MSTRDRVSPPRCRTRSGRDGNVDVRRRKNLKGIKSGRQTDFWILLFLAIVMSLVALDLLRFLAIVLMCVLAACGYGICHDQVTVCPKYFTIGHPPIFATTSPTLLALGWGVVATWWVGLSLGICLATASRVGRRSKKNGPSLIRPIAGLPAAMALCAALAGTLGYTLAREGVVSLWEPFASSVSPAMHARFLADAWAHSASYVSGRRGNRAHGLGMALAQFSAS